MINHPAYTPDEALTRETFLTLLWALSYPGRVYDLPASADPFHAIGATLLDLETSYYTPDALLGEYLARSGARALPPERAAYHFYPTLDSADLSTVACADVGTLLYPDHGATLFIGCELGGATMLKLNGPGIPSARPTTVHAGCVPAAFWTRRAAHRYPPWAGTSTWSVVRRSLVCRARRESQ